MKNINKYMLISRLIKFSPIFLISGVTFGFYLYSSTWYHDPFLVLIYCIFLLGQSIAIFQYIKLNRRYSRIHGLIHCLHSLQISNDLKHLQQSITDECKNTPEKEMIQKWLTMGLAGDHESSVSILNHTTDTQEANTTGSINTHSLFNRLALKMGFLGTLIGLVRTFPPMKKAILGLSEKDGQSQFIKDIASAIDGDEYAILTTLVATGLSIIMESLVIFVLEKLYSGIDEIHLDLYDWYIMNIKPIIVKHYSNESKQLSLMTKYAQTEKILVQTQKIIMESFEKFSDLSSKITDRLSTLETIQTNVDTRIKTLVDHENRYLNFMNIKDEASIPMELRYRKDF